VGGITPCGGGGKSNGGIPEGGGGTDISGNAGLRLYSRRSAVITWKQSPKTGLHTTILLCMCMCVCVCVCVCVAFLIAILKKKTFK